MKSRVILNVSILTEPVTLNSGVHTTKWVKGSRIRLEKNPHCRQKGQPCLDGALFRFIPDAAAREPDEGKRKARIKEWRQIVPEDAPIRELVEPVWITVATARFRKRALQGDGLFASWADAWLERK
ncbi:MAG: hypothetical protein LBD68_10915 [Zoogloeaceae bacterium]|jgi:ABC-type transport system substrate-binding protein|nr:hypothetical protein [Zoogloeaceae bacterium]